MMTNRKMCCRVLVVLSVFLASWSIAGPADDSRILQLDEATKDRCVEVLRAGLRNDDFWPSIHAAEGLTLGGHGDEVIAYLTPKLATEKDDQHRCGLARELVRAGDTSRVAIMLAILDKENDYAHGHAAESLYKIGVIGDGKALERIFAKSKNLRVRLMAAAALGKAGNGEAMAFLREMLQHEDPELFKVAAWVLGRIGAPSDIVRIKKELPRCEDVVTRAYLQHSLAALGDSEGLAALLKNLTSDDPAVRTFAATFAGDARAMAAAPMLKKMLDDPHPDARFRAAQTLLVLAHPPRSSAASRPN